MMSNERHKQDNAPCGGQTESSTKYKAENVPIVLLECAILSYLKVLLGYRALKASIPYYCVSGVLASPSPLTHSTV